MQFTLSNQGSVQLILNRYVYFWRYTYRDGARLWCCVDNRRGGCRAQAVSKEGVLCRRTGMHNHGFHDARIMRRVRAGAVFATEPRPAHAPAHTDHQQPGEGVP